MARLPEDVSVTIFDPVLPFDKVKALDPGIDTWHENVIITDRLRRSLPYIDEQEERGFLEIPGGMSISVPVVSIGFTIGSIEIPEISAFVVDQGRYDLLLGSSIFKEVFINRARGDVEIDLFPERAKSENLVIELFPVDYPVNAKNFENFIRTQRELYNITLIALKKVDPSGLPVKSIEAVIAEDEGIPRHLTLEINSVKSESIWRSMGVSLRSGSQAALKYLSSLVEKGASAKLSQELADKEALQPKISKSVRDLVAVQARRENERFSADNIHVEYENFRREILEHLNFLDDLIGRLDDPNMVVYLKKRKERAIFEMAEQLMVPIVRNVPGAHSSLVTNYLALSASTEMSS